MGYRKCNNRIKTVSIFCSQRFFETKSFSLEGEHISFRCSYIQCKCLIYNAEMFMKKIKNTILNPYCYCMMKDGIFQ